MPTITTVADDGLDWTADHPKVTIECAGKGFVEYYSLLNADHDELWSSLLEDDLKELNDLGKDKGSSSDDDSDTAAKEGSDDKLPPAIDLFSLSEKQLEKLDYYKVLHLPYKPSITPDDVKKAYRKASLKYHPDKSGRDEEDAVFLKVKAAFETLSTNKLSYDSTEMPFDDAIPSAPLSILSSSSATSSDPQFETFEAFLKEYGAVFERNAHFDAKLLPRKNGSNSSSGSLGGGGGRRKSRNKNKQQQQQQQGPPSIGDENTPIDEVHTFYDYWTHFESWRDFSLQAARELEAEDQLENAESRYEKRWYQKEIDSLARKMKKAEVVRVATLVERAMAVDPRLVQERKRLADEKEQKQREKEELALKKKQEEEEAKLAEERRIEEEKKRKTEEKFAREKEKKMFRKTKQAFKKYVSAALEELLEKEYALEDEVDMICEKLDRERLTRFNDRLDGESASDVFKMVKDRAESIKNGVLDDENDDKGAAIGDSNNAVSATPVSNGGTDTASKPPVMTNGGTTDTEKSSGKENGSNQATSSSSKKKEPFTKEELSALAKGVKKFPPGGANRWDQIANYINNSCRPENPRSKEECIEVFNQLKNSTANAAQAAAGSKATNGNTTTSNSNSNSNSNDPDAWTADQDKQLQTALAKYPASMDKNERWAKISDDVPGKSKKDCVQRFKAIRDALKAKQ
mmetsp:Transcript_57696/g.140911  ORF Transcript_57696/g.140911 Transcript_57696/m.140911 type:complete len:689 (-) Transcript_57696:114-2180(-)